MREEKRQKQLESLERALHARWGSKNKKPSGEQAGNGFKKKWDTDPAFRKRMMAVLRRNALAQAAARRER